MPINPVQMKQGAAKDPMDRVLQGLQIANEVFKIPVAYQNYRESSAKADLTRDEQQGITTKAKLGVGGFTIMPQPARQPSILPGGEAQPLLPQPEQYGPKAMTVKVRDGGEVTEVQGVRNEDRDKFFANEKGLRSEYEGHQVTKATNEMFRSGDALIDLFTKGRPLGQKDLAGVFKFIQTVEPGSFVREGEAQAAQRAGGLVAQLGNMWQQLKSGVKFDGTQRQHMVETVRQLMDTQKGLQGKIDARYGAMAQEQGFKPENVVTGFWAQQSQSKAQLSTKDLEAIDWAKKNPKDPRAVEILQMHGVK